MTCSRMIVCCFVLAATTWISAVEGKLLVHVFYESLCPDSRKFITKDLAPNYESLKDFVRIQFVPFGKSQSANDVTFTCQHGPEECALNLIQSCALSQLPNQDAQMAYVACQMSYSAERSGEDCVRKAGIPWEIITNCRDSHLGTSLQLDAERVQKSIIGYPGFVPTITYQQQFNQGLQSRSVGGDFVGVVCEMLNFTPPVCQQH